MAGFHKKRILDRASLKSRKLDKQDPLAQPPKQSSCPQCGSNRLYRDGLRYLPEGRTAQRWLCRQCYYRFSQKEPLRKNQDWQINTAPSYLSKRQVCDLLTRASKNLTTAEPKIERPSVGGTKHTEADTKGKLIEYCFHLKKQGYADETIRCNHTALRVLDKRGANLLDPESVKEVIADQKSWSGNRKRNVINAYNLFAKLNNLTWEKPKCHVTRKFPFIPMEREINDLIAGCGKKTAAFLQLLKETGMRSGEAKRLAWTDIDFEKSIVILNLPEKGSNPRMWKISGTLIGMMNALPKDSTKVFGDSSIHSIKSTFTRARKRLATKLQNPRLLRISFHTLRHWKATMLYHKTKDPYYVKQFLGHKSLQNTEIYINIERTLFAPSDDEFTVKVAEKTEDLKTLLEAGFEYVCQKDTLIFLRKRK
jgi:integrase